MNNKYESIMLVFTGKMLAFMARRCQGDQTTLNAWQRRDKKTTEGAL
jgi:hypothetical protein